MQLQITYILYFVATAFISLIILLNLKKFGIYIKEKKKPKIYIAGGFFIAVNLIIYLIYNIIFFKEINNLIIILSFLSFLIGFADDKYNLSPSSRLFSISLLVLILISQNSTYEVNFIQIFNTIFVIKFPISIIFTIICFLLITNALNFADGINCLAISIFLFVYTYILLNYFNYSILLLSLILILIFLFILNWLNICYLGDGGIYLLSFLLSVFIINTFKYNYISFSAEKIFLLLYLPGIDLVRLFFVRMYKQKNPFLGDKMHLHHYLQNKYGSKKALLFYIIVLITPITLVDVFLINKIFIFLLSFPIYLIFLYHAKN